MRPLPQLLSLLALAGPLTLACDGAPEVAPAPWRAAIVDGVAESGYGGVGALVGHDWKNNGNAYCTATLVGKRTVVTAGHCVVIKGTADLLSPIDFVVNVYRDGTQLKGTAYRAAKVVLHPSYAGGMKDDMAVIRLAQEVAGIAPLPIANLPPQLHDQLLLVGYGAPGWQVEEFGTKRSAVNAIDKLESTTFTFYGTGSGSGTVCSGDSGGPSFIQRNGGPVLAGVHSVTLGDENATDPTKLPCAYAGADMRVDSYHSFLVQHAEGDLVEEGQDSTPPTVSFQSPQNGAAVAPPFQVTLIAADDKGLQLVTLAVDGQQVGSRGAAPFVFDVQQLADGTHTLQARAVDKAGNDAQAELSVVVGGGSIPTAEMGEPCESGEQCQSGLCIATGQGKLCSQACVQREDCGAAGFDCQAGNCVPDGSQTTSFAGEGGVLLGGCQLGAGASSGGVMGAGWLLLVGLGLLLRRRCHRR